MDTHNDKNYYLINNEIEFWPALNRLVSCKSRKVYSLFIPSSECLLTLIKNQPEIVTQTDLIRRGWGEHRYTHVSTNAFYQCIVSLRKVLKEAGLEPDIIRTIPRRGLKIPAYISVLMMMTDESSEKHHDKETIHDAVKNTVVNNRKDEIHRIADIQHMDQIDTTVRKTKPDKFKKSLKEKIQFRLPNPAFREYDPKNKTLTISFSLRKNITVLFAFVTITCLSSFILKESLEDFQRHNILQHYDKYKETIGKCEFYFNNNAVTYDKHISFINNHNIDCTYLNKAFISSNFYSLQTSVIQCQFENGYLSKKYCISRYYADYEE